MMEKLRVKVKAGSNIVPSTKPASEPSKRGDYLRDTRSGIIAARPAYIREHRDEIRRVWERTAALAMDLIQNSGRLKGTLDQIIADTVGSELSLNPQPDLTGLGYDDAERRDFIALIKLGWKRYAWNASECDVRGRLTIPQQGDVGIRWWMAYGESLSSMEYFDAAKRRRYGIQTGPKVLMIPPHRLVNQTIEVEGLYQGVIQDENGRVEAYRTRSREDGLLVQRTLPARDRKGRTLVSHVFDPIDATDVRGLSPLASAFRRHIQHETLDDATLQMAVLQTVFAVTLTSDRPSADAFEALEALKDAGGEGAAEIASDFANYFAAQLDRAADSSINISGDPTVSHLAPGEKLGIETAKVPGGTYLPFAASLSRDMARAMGVTYGGLTMDYTDATYSSVRMETSSIWPLVVRRRDRIAAPHYQVPYEHWLEAEIAEGRIPLKGGIEAFEANRDRICWAQWQGPAKPTADDLKSAKAASEKIANGTTSLERQCAEDGVDHDEIFEERLREHRRYVDAGMVSPYDRNKPSTAAGTEELEKQEKTDG
ncbi:phage portal protein [Agrobacterium pusense]|uniref:phage portal protein n=1 Tax=Agrobacterium pusense TaxID=648995 RepID=UPI000D1AD760|nr:phage portal protein [Agrobacterium pusense]